MAVFVVIVPFLIVIALFACDIAPDCLYILCRRGTVIELWSWYRLNDLHAFVAENHSSSHLCCKFLGNLQGLTVASQFERDDAPLSGERLRTQYLDCKNFAHGKDNLCCFPRC